MSHPRRAALGESRFADDAVESPRRGVQRKNLASIATPLGIVGPLAAVLAVSLVSTASGVPTSPSPSPSTASNDVASRVAVRSGIATEDASVITASQEKQVTRDLQRPKIPATVAPVALKATGTHYATAALIVRQTPLKTAASRGTIAEGTAVKITDATMGVYRQIIYKGTSGWVSASYLSAKKPATTAATGGTVTLAACKLGSSVESGLKTNTIKAYRSICANFPQIKTYGGVRADSLPYHPSGRALDVMLPSISDNALGWQIARWVVAHASEFNIDHVIFDQQIWIPGQGWSGMSDRGGATANHRDHVHVAVKS